MFAKIQNSFLITLLLFSMGSAGMQGGGGTKLSPADVAYLKSTKKWDQSLINTVTLTNARNPLEDERVSRYLASIANNPSRREYAVSLFHEDHGIFTEADMLLIVEAFAQRGDNLNLPLVPDDGSPRLFPRLIHRSVEWDRPLLLQLLLALPYVDPNVRNGRDGRGSTALHLAVQLNRTNLLPILLNRPGVDINAQDADGHTPIQIAVRQNIELTRNLLTHPSPDPVRVTDEFISSLSGNVGLARMLEEARRGGRLVVMTTDGGMTGGDDFGFIPLGGGGSSTPLQSSSLPASPDRSILANGDIPLAKEPGSKEPPTPGGDEPRPADAGAPAQEVVKQAGENAYNVPKILAWAFGSVLGTANVYYLLGLLRAVNETETKKEEL